MHRTLCLTNAQSAHHHVVTLHTDTHMVANDAQRLVLISFMAIAVCPRRFQEAKEEGKSQEGPGKG